MLLNADHGQCLRIWRGELDGKAWPITRRQQEDRPEIIQPRPFSLPGGSECIAGVIGSLWPGWTVMGKVEDASGTALVALQHGRQVLVNDHILRETSAAFSAVAVNGYSCGIKLAHRTHRNPLHEVNADGTIDVFPIKLLSHLRLFCSPRMYCIRVHVRFLSERRA